MWRRVRSEKWVEDDSTGERTCKKWAKLSLTAATKTHAWLYAAIDALEDWHSTCLSLKVILEHVRGMPIRGFKCLMSVMWNTLACYVNDKLFLYWLTDKFKSCCVNTQAESLCGQTYFRELMLMCFSSASPWRALTQKIGFRNICWLKWRYQLDPIALTWHFESPRE